MKRCSECGRKKPLTEFPESHPGKLRTRCRPCYRAYQRRQAQLYYWQHREERVAAATAYRDANREKVTLRNREYWRKKRRRIESN
jgi:hypothetical protein